MFGDERIVAAIDVRGGRAVGHGWVSGGDGPEAQKAIRRLAGAGVTIFEVTAIDRDGLLEGPDLPLYERLVALRRGSIIASGGIASLADLRAVRAAGCAGAILGRALYEGHIELAEALEVA
jgi:phosphoribosylformimino-5-aminoimidazole carboxamide ribotide isomerase